MPLRIWSREWFSTTNTSSLVTVAPDVARAGCAAGVDGGAACSDGPVVLQADDSSSAATASAADPRRSGLTPPSLPGAPTRRRHDPKRPHPGHGMGPLVCPGQGATGRPWTSSSAICRNPALVQGDLLVM